MLEGRAREIRAQDEVAWERNARIEGLLTNVNRKRKRPYVWQDFTPYPARRKGRRRRGRMSLTPKGLVAMAESLPEKKP